MARKPKERTGDRAVRLGFITSEQLGVALSMQSERKVLGKPHLPLGMLFLDQEWIGVAQLIELLGKPSATLSALPKDAIDLAARVVAYTEEGPQILAFGGFQEASGTTAIVAQLGVVLALMDHAPILLVDANDRNPSLHTRFQIPQAPGLSEYLTGSESLENVSYESGVAGLMIMPSGLASGTLAGSFMAERGQVMLRGLAEKFRVVLIDCPPFNQFAEATVLAQRVDGVVAVAIAGRQRASQVVAFAESMRQVRANLLGIVLSHPAPENPVAAKTIPQWGRSVSR